ncbi:MAG: adenylate kinase [Muribaculaceae bacterium]|nr:adenylate kinase [Muribaculaceae bacterium]
MPNIIIFGAPGSGKGTQSERIIEKYNLHHISTGELLRDHIARKTELGIVADSYCSRGQLIPDDLMIEILAHTIDNNPQASKGLILDGFPRTIPQARALKQLLAERGMKIDSVIGLEVPEDELIERLLKRGQESGRSDDNLDTINKRLEVYHSQTLPLRDYYINEGKYRAIHATGSIDEIFNRIAEVIEA